MTPAQDATALADISFPRWWIQQIRDQLFTWDKLPSGPLGDWAFLFREQLNDKLLDSAALRATSQTPDAVQRHFFVPRHSTNETCELCSEPYEHRLHIGSLAEHRYSHSVGRSTPSASAGPQAEAVAIQNMLEPRRSEQEHRRYLEASRRADTYRKERDMWKAAAEAEAAIGSSLAKQLEVALAAHPQPQQADGRGKTIQNAAEQSATANRASGSPPTVPPSGAIRSNGELVLSADGRGAVPERETCWLIERDGGLYTTCLVSRYPSWSTDPWRAARYSTAREADNARLMIADDRCRNESTAVEHVFINKMPRSLQQSPATGKAPAIGAAPLTCNHDGVNSENLK